MNETTDEHGSVLLSPKSFASCQGLSSVCSQGRNLRVLCVPAVRFFLVAAGLLCVHLWFPSVQFRLRAGAGFWSSTNCSEASRRRKTNGARSEHPSGGRAGLRVSGRPCPPPGSGVHPVSQGGRVPDPCQRW